MSILLLLTLTACSSSIESADMSVSPAKTEEQPVLDITDSPGAASSEKSSSSLPAVVIPEFEIELVAKTLRGECYDDQPDDKREVVKVICNRVAAGFGDSIEAVITASHQFAGYKPDNKPTTNDYEIAHEVLTEWYVSGCAAMGEYLYFTAGGGRTNIFRKEWKESS
jgi:hypothetical protein